MLLTNDDIFQMIKPIAVRRKLICIHNALNSVTVENDYQLDHDACVSQLSTSTAFVVDKERGNGFLDDHEHAIGGKYTNLRIYD